MVAFFLYEPWFKRVVFTPNNLTNLKNLKALSMSQKVFFFFILVISKSPIEKQKTFPRGGSVSTLC